MGYMRNYYVSLNDFIIIMLIIVISYMTYIVVTRPPDTSQRVSLAVDPTRMPVDHDRSNLTEDERFTRTAFESKPNVFTTRSNNGACNCTIYCASNWNNEAPAQWEGAKCIRAYDYLTGGEKGCDYWRNPKDSKPIECTCQRTNGPWMNLQKKWAARVNLCQGGGAPTVKSVSFRY